MSTMNTRTHAPVLLLIGIVLGLLAYQSQAHRPAAVIAQPTVVATVDLETVFNQLKEREARHSALQAQAQALVDKNDGLQAEIEQLQLDLEDYARGSDKFLEIEDQLLRKTFEFQAQVTFAKRITQLRNAESIKEIYLNIKKAAANLARERGIDLVFVDDTKVEIQDGDEQQINQQISARRMLYVNPAIDITQDLIAVMNGQFQARAGN